MSDGTVRDLTISILRSQSYDLNLTISTPAGHHVSIETSRRLDVRAVCSHALFAVPAQTAQTARRKCCILWTKASLKTC